MPSQVTRTRTLSSSARTQQHRYPILIDILLHHTSDAGKNLASSLPPVAGSFHLLVNDGCTASEEKKYAWFDLYSLTDTNKRQDLQDLD